MKKSAMGKLQKFHPRPFGGGHKRKLPIPDERTLMDMSIKDMEDLSSKIQSIIARKRKMDTWGYHRGKVYAELVKLLEGKLYPLTNELLTVEAINALTPQQLQLINLGDHELEMKVYAALKPFRDTDGKLKV